MRYSGFCDSLKIMSVLKAMPLSKVCTFVELLTESRPDIRAAGLFFGVTQMFWFTPHLEQTIFPLQFATTGIVVFCNYVFCKPIQVLKIMALFAFVITWCRRLPPVILFYFMSLCVVLDSQSG